MTRSPAFRAAPYLVAGVLAFTLLAECAGAQDVAPGKTCPPTASPNNRSRLLPGDDRCTLYVEIIDRPGCYEQEDTLPSPFGPIVVYYSTHLGHSIPDSAEVISLPRDLVAIPPFAELAPNEPTHICLIIYTGA